VPFALERRDGRFEGGLLLGASADPLPCHWRQSSDVETLALAWTLALVAYAELTCIPVEPVPPPGPPRRPRTASRRPAASARHAGERSRDAPRSSGGSIALPADFRARGQTARYLASYVAGHRRRLASGWTRSDEAERNARAVGITLRHGETWVQPHVRGVPRDAVLHFAWQAPGWVHAVLAARASSRDAPSARPSRS
jgi:hypothetical protein